MDQANSSGGKNKLRFIVALAFYFGLWITISIIFKFSSIYIVPVIIICGFFIYKIIDTYLVKMKKIKLNILKSSKGSQFSTSVILYTILSSAIFLGFYYAISLSYPWTLIYPPNFSAFLSTFILIPLYFSSELFYRKILTPFSTFINSRQRRTILITVVSIIFQLYLVSIAFLFLGGPIMIASFLAYLMSSVMNAVIYHKTGSFSAVLLNSIIVNGCFFGSSIPFLLSLF